MVSQCCSVVLALVESRAKRSVKVKIHDSGDVAGDMAGESSRLWSLVVTIVKGAGLGPTVDDAGGAALPFALGLLVFGGVGSSSSSGIGGQYVLSTCFSAGRRMGFDRKKSMPEARHSYRLLALAATLSTRGTDFYIALLGVGCESYNG